MCSFGLVDRCITLKSRETTSALSSGGKLQSCHSAGLGYDVGTSRCIFSGFFSDHEVGEAVRHRLWCRPVSCLTTILCNFLVRCIVVHYFLVPTCVCCVLVAYLMFLGRTSRSSCRVRNVFVCHFLDRLQVNTPLFCQGVAARFGTPKPDFQPAHQCLRFVSVSDSRNPREKLCSEQVCHRWFERSRVRTQAKIREVWQVRHGRSLRDLTTLRFQAERGPPTIRRPPP